MMPCGSTMNVARSGTPFLLVQDAERGRQLPLGIRQHRIRQRLEVGVVAAPREVDEVRVVLMPSS
jgi:hypothetical protein